MHGGVRSLQRGAVRAEAALGRSVNDVGRMWRATWARASASEFGGAAAGCRRAEGIDQNWNLTPSWMRRAGFVLFVVVPKTVVLTNARVV